MNGAIGGALLFRTTSIGEGYNSTDIALLGEGPTLYLDVLFRKHINKVYAVQFGPAITFDIVVPLLTVNFTFQVGLAF